LAASGFVSGFVTGLGFGFAGAEAGGEAAGADCWARAGASQAATHAAATSSQSTRHRRIPNRRIRRRCIRTLARQSPKSHQSALIANISTFIQFERAKSCAHASVQMLPARFPNPRFSWLEKRGPKLDLTNWIRGMKAVLCTHFGPPEALQLADIDAPGAGPGEALVRVKAVALNFFDTLLIGGKYQHKPPFPFSPGAEFAGFVESVGSGAADIAPGDRVIGYSGWGAARELVAASVQRLVKIPDRLDFERAAGVTVTYGTTLYALRERAELKPGESLVVLGASGGTGLATIELGKLMGARVIACASSDDKLAFAREHGADETVNYEREDLRGALKKLGGERGIDVVYDPVGGRYAEPALRSLGWLGRYLVIGFATGEIPKMPLNLALLKSCDIRGVAWGAWTSREPRKQRGLMADILKWTAEGKLSAHVQAVYPLSETAAALEVLAARKAMGKIVLRI
jgi:NADPH2:quinone reductase